MGRQRQFVSEGSQRDHLQMHWLNLQEREVPCKESEFKAFTGMKAFKTPSCLEAAE